MALLHRLVAGIGAALRPLNLVSAFVILVVAASAYYADGLNRTLQEQQVRSAAARQLGVIRAKLEGNINGNMQLVRGLVAVIEAQPQMTQTEFSSIARPLFGPGSQLRDIAAAPDLKVALLYPVIGNEGVMGLDYTANPAQRDAVQRARDARQLIVAGPVRLIQGGIGFVGRFPVYTTGANGDQRFWGMVSGVVDAEKLYAASGLYDPELDIDIAIRGVDGSGSKGDVFFGDPNILTEDPVISDVALPMGSWHLVARPLGGWAAAMPDPFGFRMLLALAAALILLPLAVVRVLFGERAGHVQALRQRETQLEELSHRLNLALDASHVGVWEYNTATHALLWDDRMNELYGYPRDGGIRTFEHWRNVVHPDDLPASIRAFDDAIQMRSRYDLRFRVVLPDGAIRVIREIATVYEHADGNLRVVGCNWDITADVANKDLLERARALAEARNAELVEATAQIEHTSLHDALTQLPNRRYLDRVIAERCNAARRDGTAIGLLHLDVDRFKQINDTLGHAAGDAMLVHVANVLRANVRADDFVARIGGDEFVVLCAVPDGRRRDLARLAQRILSRMRHPVMCEGHECRGSVSVGIAHQRGQRIDEKRLLVDADIALYRAKGRGRNRAEFFTEALQAEIVETKRMADEILVGIEEHQFVAWYQPQFDAATHHITGVEALVRWNHPRLGLIAPDRFMSIAEDLSVMATIDAMVLEQTLAAMRTWRAEGVTIPHASVNVSARRLRDEHLVRSLKRLEIERGTISFELVESIYLDEKDDVLAFNIDAIRELGIDIEIDDFGTGYASIVSLLQLRPRRLKIDRQLIQPIVNAPSSRQMLASIVDMGHSMGIEVVAEGVETLEHARVAHELGCDALQGYAMARPMRRDAIADFVRDWRSTSRAA